MQQAAEGAIDLSRKQYEALHDGDEVELQYSPQSEFAITHIGEKYDPSFQDLSIEYYSYVS